MRSCFNVAQIIVLRRSADVNARFIRVPLDLKSPHGLALLSCLINSTPGTVWVDEPLLVALNLKVGDPLLDSTRVCYENHHYA